MRDILFRGKRTDNGEWVEGYLFKVGRTSHILLPIDRGQYNPDKKLVNDESVGQFTGLLDKNEKKIFEGDLVKSHVGHESRKNDLYQVIYRLGCASLWPNNSETPVSFATAQDQIWNYIERSFDNSLDKYLEIFGNIHDNPELL